MSIDKKLLNIILVFLLIVIISSGILFKNFFTSFSQVGELEKYYYNFNSYNDLSSDILLMTINLQDYISYSEGEYLDIYFKHSSLAIKKELELLNSASLDNKQEILDMIEMTKSYISFVDKEVIPVIKSNEYSTEDLKSLHLRNKVFSQELTEKLRATTSANHIRLIITFKVRL
ncbi:hypothetical protein N752_23960 [Desulforamulus aquiferis]|nr:hypothetical protein [Desulforamulus aquiferis]RYD02390.1 hypothetical protein N752_23960 [Desulforamulus aquiferis]